MKRIVSLFLAVAMALSLAACGKTPSSSTSGEGTGGRKKLTIGIGNSSKVLDYEDNWFTNYMEELHNIDIEFDFFSNDSGERKSQLTTMVAGGEKLPDILFNFSFNTDEIHIYGQDGYFMDLAPYFDDPDWEIAKKWGWHENMLKYNGEDAHRNALYAYRDAKGALYTWPSSCPSPSDRTVAMPFINVSWLEKLGLEMPTTYDELVEVLRAFKTQDPNGNGVADEIPMIGSTTLYCGDAPQWIINNFGEYCNDMYFYTYDDNGKIQVPYTTEKYRDGVRALHELVEEGLLAPQTWTMKEKAELTSLWTPAEGQTTVGVVFGHPTTFATYGDEDILQYEALPPLEGSYAPMRAVMGTKSFFITTDCEDFETAAEFLMSFVDLAVARACRRGEEGVDWVEDIDVNSGMPGVRQLQDVFSEATRKTWAVNGPYVGFYGDGSPWSSGTFEVKETTDPGGHRGQLLADTSGINIPYAAEHNPKKTFATAVYTEEEVSENGNRLAEIKTYVKEARAKFAVGQLDINSDTDWNNYINTMEKMGLSILIENTQAAIDRLPKS